MTEEKKFKECLCCSSVFTLDSSLFFFGGVSCLFLFFLFQLSRLFLFFNFHVFSVLFYPNLCFLQKIPLNFFLYKTRKKREQDKT